MINCEHIDRIAELAKKYNENRIEGKRKDLLNFLKIWGDATSNYYDPNISVWLCSDGDKEYRLVLGGYCFQGADFHALSNIPDKVINIIYSRIDNAIESILNQLEEYEKTDNEEKKTENYLYISEEFVDFKSISSSFNEDKRQIQPLKDKEWVDFV